jgi:long-chain acyl-CoA synthetase
MEDANLSLVEAQQNCARRFGNLPAIHFMGKTLSHAQFDALSDRIAAALAAQGIRPGERVGLYCINSDAFAIAYFGVLKAGGTVVPINVLLNPKEIAYILQDAGAAALFYHEMFGDSVKAFRGAVSTLRLAICIGAANPLGDMSYADLLAGNGQAPALSIQPADDLAAILYTSGTTGKPKGAMLTHRNLASNVASIREALKLTPGEDVMLCVLPMFHAFAATVCMLFPLTNGCAVAPLPKFDPQLVADTIAAYRVTILPAVPSMYRVLLRLPETEIPKFASLRYAISGGAALPVEVMRQFEAKFGKAIYEGDGPTECSPVTCVNPIGGLRKPGSVGLPVPNVEMKIVDDAGREVPRGTIGEIVVRGPNVMKGYWNHPEETRAAFFGDWFRTGDLGTEDADGYFFIVDRKKDLIIVNGMNVYPRVVEEVLYQHPAVREAAVVGEPDELHGEIPVAFVALKEGALTDPQEIRRHCREHLGRHEVPHKVIFMNQLPKNAAGKILKRELRKSGEYERGVDSRDA